MPITSIHHNNDGLLDVAGFGDISSQNDIYYHMSRPFNPQQQNREFNNNDENSSPVYCCDQSLDGGASTTCSQDDLWEHPTLDVRKSSACRTIYECDTTVCTSSQSTCAYDDWNDDLSIGDASAYSAQSCYARLPTPSSSLPSHPSFGSVSGEGLNDTVMGMGSLPPLETLCEQSQATDSDEDDISDDHPDTDLEKRIAELSLKIATVRGEVDTCSFECKKIADESSRKKRRAEELRRENEALRKKVEEMERQAILEAMDATQGKKVVDSKKLTSSQPEPATKRVLKRLFSIKTVNFADTDDY